MCDHSNQGDRTREQLIPVLHLISTPKTSDLHANEGCWSSKWCVCVCFWRSFVCVCALLSTSVCLQLIKGCASIDYSHVVKQPLFSSPLIKDAAWRKSWFIVILMLVWVYRKNGKKKRGGGFSMGNLLFIYSTSDPQHPHTQPLPYTNTHTCSVSIFSNLSCCSLCISWDVR